MKTICKKMMALILIPFLAYGLPACGKGGDSPNEEKQVSDERKPITITRFNDLITEDFVDALHEVYPEINLKIVSYAGCNGSGYAQFSLEAGDMPDIYVSTQPFCRELQPERLLDLSSYDFVNNYSTFMLNSLDVNGGIYLLPTGYTVSGMWYNKTIMKENGWEVPNSFEELTALIPEIEAAGYRPFVNAMDLDGYPFNYFFSLGNTVYFGTQEGTQWKENFPEGKASAVGNEGLQEAVDYYNEWVENGIITDEHTSVVEYQESGDIVFCLCLGLTKYEYEAEDGNTYEFGIMPWLSQDGSNNMLTRNISRYFGINKHLTEPGNEQELEDALRVLEFVSSRTGQESIMSSANVYMLPLNDSEMAGNNPYQEVAGVIDSGHSVPMVYVGWEELIIPIARDLRALIRREISADEVLTEFDATYSEVANAGAGTVFGILTEDLTYEKTAELCAIATGKAADADCAMVSLNEYHGNNNYNSRGVGWYLWEGQIGTEKVNMIRTDNKAIAVLIMTGSEIKAMQEEGFDFDENGNPYEYVLVTKGNTELDDAAAYRLAIGVNEIPKAMQDSAQLVEIPTDEAVEKYIRELGTFGAADIIWNE